MDGEYSLRVADWGLSAVVEDLSTALLRTQCGTVRPMHACVAAIHACSHACTQ